LVLSGHADICVLGVPVRILLNHFAHVSKITHVYFFDCNSVSYALWKKNRIILVITIAVSLANTVAFFYSLCLSPSVLYLLTQWSDIAITRAYRTASFCDVDHILETRITIFSSFITDLVLLSLMMIGILRWKHARQTGGIWRVMYTQVGISCIATLTTQPNSILAIGIDICCNRHTCGYTSSGAFGPHRFRTYV
jgi:hypothetical protein